MRAGIRTGGFDSVGSVVVRDEARVPWFMLDMIVRVWERKVVVVRGVSCRLTQDLVRGLKYVSVSLSAQLTTG